MALGIVLLVTSLVGGVRPATARSCRNGSWKTVRFVEQRNQRLHLMFKFRKFFDRKLRSKLKSGISRHIYLEATVYREKQRRRIKTIIRDCRVHYDVWTGSYSITVVDPSGTHRYKESGWRKAVRRIADVDLSLGPVQQYPRQMRFYVEIRILFAPMPSWLVRQIRNYIKNQSGSKIIRGGSPIAPAIVIRVHSRISRALKRVKYCTQSTWRP